MAISATLTLLFALRFGGDAVELSRLETAARTPRGDAFGEGLCNGALAYTLLRFVIGYSDTTRCGSHQFVCLSFIKEVEHMYMYLLDDFMFRASY
jgi:hypothetical protein